MKTEGYSVEEVRARLKQLGIPVEEWQEPEHENTKSFTIPTFKRQAEALEKLKALLETQINKDAKMVAELHEKVNRLHHGGGK